MEPPAGPGSSGRSSRDSDLGRPGREGNCVCDLEPKCSFQVRELLVKQVQALGQARAHQRSEGSWAGLMLALMALQTSFPRRSWWGDGGARTQRGRRLGPCH